MKFFSPRKSQSSASHELDESFVASPRQVVCLGVVLWDRLRHKTEDVDATLVAHVAHVMLKLEFFSEKHPLLLEDPGDFKQVCIRSQQCERVMCRGRELCKVCVLVGQFMMECIQRILRAAGVLKILDQDVSTFTVEQADSMFNWLKTHAGPEGSPLLRATELQNIKQKIQGLVYSET